MVSGAKIKVSKAIYNLQSAFIMDYNNKWIAYNQL